jgi:hypothetical protein
MLDALKFAFEIFVVGALALPWLAVLGRIFPSDDESSFSFYLSPVPKSARSAVTVAVVVAFGYLLGSAISRISRNFFNDELWKKVPTEHLIRDAVYMDVYCKEHLVKDMYMPFAADLPKPDRAGSGKNFGLCPKEIPIAKRDSAIGPGLTPTQIAELTSNPDGEGVYQMTRDDETYVPVPYSKVTDASKGGYHAKAGEPERYANDQMSQFPERVLALFRLQEGKLLLQGQDKVDRLKQFFDQITILRGAAFNGFVLLVVCAFGICGNLKVRWSGRPVVKFAAYLPACAMILASCYWFHVHLGGKAFAHDPNAIYNHPPLTEFVFLLLGLLGALIVFKAREIRPHFRTFVLAAVVTLISFGGWWWTEIMYDTLVIHSWPTMGQQ